MQFLLVAMSVVFIVLVAAARFRGYQLPTDENSVLLCKKRQVLLAVASCHVNVNVWPWYQLMIKSTLTL